MKKRIAVAAALMILFALTSTYAQTTQYFLYVTISGTNVSAYMIDPSTGALAEVNGSPFAAGRGPVGISVDRTSKFVYVANNGSANVSAYTIDPTTGTLTAVGGSPFAAGSNPVGITADPTGKLALREEQAGPHGAAERPVVVMKPGNAGGAKGPWFRESARRSEGRGDWREPNNPTEGRETTKRATRESEGIAQLSFLQSVEITRLSRRTRIYGDS